jgi:5-methylcytosine-specific restriction endonuclease McrA
VRFIDLEELKPSIRDLIPPLKEAQAEVNKETDPELRAALIKRYRPRWVALREAFDRFSYGKCWYTESKNPGSDDDVDHFRPKGRVAEDGKHDGYYWLAFDWANFRLSCHRANRLRSNPETGDLGGKADHFPLIDPSARAYVESDDIRKEEPALLDPTEMVDVLMLTFDAAGDATLAPDYRGNQKAERKLDESIRYLHLNWPKFREERLVIYHRVERLVDRGARCAPAGRMHMNSVTDAFKGVLHDLHELTSPRSAYSQAARAYVELFSHEWWVRDIVLKVV